MGYDHEIMNNLSLEFHLGHLGPLNVYLTIQKFSIELQSLFWYRIYHQSKLDVLLVNSYEKLLIKLEMKTNFRIFRVFENAEISFLSSWCHLWFGKLVSYPYFDSINMISRISQPLRPFPRFPRFRPGLGKVLII